MEREGSIPLVLGKTLFPVPETPYSGIIASLQKMLPTTMEIRPDGVAQLPVFAVDGYNVFIRPGPGFRNNLMGPKYCGVDNPWYKPLEEVVRDRQQQPLTIADITCEGPQELSFPLFESLLAVLHSRADWEISNSIQLTVSPNGEKEVYSASIQAQTSSHLTHIAIMYHVMREGNVTKHFVPNPNIRLFYSNLALETEMGEGHTRVQDLLTFEALYSTLVNDPKRFPRPNSIQRA